MDPSSGCSCDSSTPSIAVGSLDSAESIGQWLQWVREAPEVRSERISDIQVALLMDELSTEYAAAEAARAFLEQEDWDEL